MIQTLVLSLIHEMDFLSHSQIVVSSYTIKVLQGCESFCEKSLKLDFVNSKKNELSHSCYLYTPEL